MTRPIAFAVRHGETKLNKGKMYRSWVNAELDRSGKDDAKQIAAFLMKFPVAKIFCSPLRRALDTAYVYADQAGHEVEEDSRLMPWHLGVFGGLSRLDNDEALSLFVKSPDTKIPNGESLSEFEERCFEFFEGALKDATEDSITVMFTHTSNITALDNFVDGETKAIPEGGETVGPGGIVAVYSDGKGYKTKPIMGDVERAAFGGS